MKHFIIVKFKKDYNYKDELNNIKDLFNKSIIYGKYIESKTIFDCE